MEWRGTDKTCVSGAASQSPGAGNFWSQQASSQRRRNICRRCKRLRGCRHRERNRRRAPRRPHREMASRKPLSKVRLPTASVTPTGDSATLSPTPMLATESTAPAAVEGSRRSLHARRPSNAAAPAPKVNPLKGLRPIPPRGFNQYRVLCRCSWACRLMGDCPSTQAGGRDLRLA